MNFQLTGTRITLVLLILGYFLFFHLVGARTIWTPDEDEYALVNWEMVEHGHWIYPTANGEPYAIKPPFFNWVGSLISLANGEVTEFTSRVPSSIAALIGLFLLYLLGTALFGRRAGFLSALVIATTPLYIEFGRWIQINMMSTMFLTATLLLFYLGYSCPEKRKWAYPLMYVPMGLGTLNMGPVNLVMPAAVIGAFLLAVRDPRSLLGLKYHWGIPIYLLIAAPWYVAVSLKGGYFDDLIVRSNLSRTFGEFAHRREFYYYFITTPPYFLPWTLYLPGTVYAIFKRTDSQERKAALFPVVWFASLFVLFSIANTKRSEYLLPVFPAMALMVGFFLDRAIDNWDRDLFWRRAFLWPTWAVLAAGILIGMGIPVVTSLTDPSWTLILIPVSTIILSGAVIGWILLRKGHRLYAFFSICLIITSVVAYGAGPIVKKKNPTASSKDLSLLIAQRIPEGEKLRSYKFYRPSYAYYTKRFIEKIKDLEDLEDYLRTEDRVYFLTRDSEYEKLQEKTDIPLFVAEMRYVDGRDIYLLSNQAD